MNWSPACSCPAPKWGQGRVRDDQFPISLGTSLSGHLSLWGPKWIWGSHQLCPLLQRSLPRASFQGGTLGLVGEGRDGVGMGGAAGLLSARVQVHRWLLTLLGVGACPPAQPGHLQTHHPPEVLGGSQQGLPLPRPAPTPPAILPTPLADEPTSPSIDLKAKHVPASSVVSSAMNSAPAVATSPSSPTFAFALSRHYSQDCSKCWAGGTVLGATLGGQDGEEQPPALELCPVPAGLSSACFALLPLAGSIKAGRRSSYLLAITTERSKSCDDGLNAFRDEGKILR